MTEETFKLSLLPARVRHRFHGHIACVLPTISVVHFTEIARWLVEAICTMAVQRFLIVSNLRFASSSSRKYAAVQLSYKSISYSIYMLRTFCAKPATVVFQCPDEFL